ncbi:GNAT family N-acetyltransferase [Streptomyces hilarionis]|uniref:GNAT family N-acetyltransferase n=1 Tax=Streptomyces hilarionis TaxID=2839954 RepID=UPI0027953FFF|nr:GNAT family N-acetyltransferase [Streptomyces hilarionis]
MIALYFLARALWGAADDQAVPVGEDTVSRLGPGRSAAGLGRRGLAATLHAGLLDRCRRIVGRPLGECAAGQLPHRPVLPLYRRRDARLHAGGPGYLLVRGERLGEAGRLHLARLHRPAEHLVRRPQPPAQSGAGAASTVPTATSTAAGGDVAKFRAASHDHARSVCGAETCLPSTQKVNPCYAAWLERSLDALDQSPTDREQSVWADALAEEVRAAYPGVHLSLSVSRGYLLLFLITIPNAERGNGLGTRVMQHLISAADQRGIAMTLNPTDNFGADLDRLQDFYRRFGFITNKWCGEIGASGESMIRVPRNSSAAADNPACSSSCCQESTV